MKYILLALALACTTDKKVKSDESLKGLNLANFQVLSKEDREELYILSMMSMSYEFVKEALEGENGLAQLYNLLYSENQAQNAGDANKKARSMFYEKVLKFISRPYLGILDLDVVSKVQGLKLSDDKLRYMDSMTEIFQDLSVKLSELQEGRLDTVNIFKPFKIEREHYVFKEVKLSHKVELLSRYFGYLTDELKPVIDEYVDKFKVKAKNKEFEKLVNSSFKRSILNVKNQSEALKKELEQLKNLLQHVSELPVSEVSQSVKDETDEVCRNMQNLLNKLAGHGANDRGFIGYVDYFYINGHKEEV